MVQIWYIKHGYTVSKGIEYVCLYSIRKMQVIDMKKLSPADTARRFSVAPMMDWRKTLFYKAL